MAGNLERRPTHPGRLRFPPSLLIVGLCVLLARGIADRLHAGDIGIRDIRQILNPLRDIRHALHRREVQAERPSRPEKICAVIRRQVVKRPRGERQFARRHVRHDLVVRGASDPFVAGQATTHPLVLGRPAHPRPHRRILDARDFPGCRGFDVVLTCCLTDGSASAEGDVGEEGRVGFRGFVGAAVPGSRGLGHDLRVTFRREFLCLWPACLLPSNRRSFVAYRYFLTAPRSAVAPAL